MDPYTHCFYIIDGYIYIEDTLVYKVYAASCLLHQNEKKKNYLQTTLATLIEFFPQTMWKCSFFVSVYNSLCFGHIHWFLDNTVRHAGRSRDTPQLAILMINRRKWNYSFIYSKLCCTYTNKKNFNSYKRRYDLFICLALATILPMDGTRRLFDDGPINWDAPSTII